MRIDEHEGAAAAQHELVDGEQRLVRQVLRMDEHEHADIRRDLGGVTVDRAHVEELLHLGVDDPGVALLAGPAEGALQRQRGQKADGLLLHAGEVEDQLGEVDFEEALALGLEEGDDLFLVGAVDAGETEIDELAGLIDRHALQAEPDGAVFLIREGLRVDDLQADLAVRGVAIFLQHLADAAGVDAVGRDLLAQALRIIKAQRHRLGDAREHGARAGERV